MKRRRTAVNLEEAQLIRLAWWGGFFATIALIAILGLARSAQAMTLPVGDPLATATSFVPEEEDEESEDEEESESAECESEDEAEEEECEAEAEEEAEAPRECVLSSARATVTAAT